LNSAGQKKGHSVKGMSRSEVPHLIHQAKELFLCFDRTELPSTNHCPVPPKSSNVMRVLQKASPIRDGCQWKHLSTTVFSTPPC